MPEALYTLGVIRLQQSKLAEAAIAFRSAVAAKQDYAEAHYALGTVLQQQGDTAGAIAAFREALRYAPDAPEIHNTLGTALRQKGDAQAARLEFLEAARLNKLKSDRQAAIFALNTGIARLKEGDVDAAVERLEAAVKLDPKNAQAFYHLAGAYQQKGQKAAALVAYRKAKELDPRVKPLPQN
jgi:Tfp pilus assembly protein PilF